MKKLTILLFSILIPFSSYGGFFDFSSSNAGWTKVIPLGSGSIRTYYINNDKIIENDGYVYWWDLADYLIPEENGNMSNKDYMQGDCRRYRSKPLSSTYYKQPMGQGIGSTGQPTYSEWYSPTHDMVAGRLLDYVCDYVD